MTGVTADGFATVSPMPGAPLFADDNSSYRRAARRAEREERVREERRREIMATLRRLKEEAGDTAVVAERERARRHADMLERYPPLF
jgi:multidrug resistance efflux pump